ncbi:hypothetical protein [Sediminibacter sp. Hel_I_10]|uniref:hypothetical protein n=1 Tax=Sediminibacter sp. Hel_I_10 TaxID=1392490 RepID=UPI00047DE038|nr:hypothetical protein [Sediminibacter sp. Hel_I_10]
MKKVILIAIAFISLQAIAQDKNRGDRDGRLMQDLSAEEMATIKTKKMTLHLDLTEAQQAKVKTVLLEEATQRKQNMESHRALRENKDSEKPSKEARIKMINEKLDHQIAMKQKMKSVLNDQQYAKWESSLKEKRNGRKGKHADRSGHRE